MVTTRLPDDVRIGLWFAAVIFAVATWVYAFRTAQENTALRNELASVQMGTTVLTLDTIAANVLIGGGEAQLLLPTGDTLKVRIQ